MGRSGVWSTAVWVLGACTPVEDVPSVAKPIDAGPYRPADGPVAWNPDLGTWPVTAPPAQSRRDTGTEAPPTAPPPHEHPPGAWLDAGTARPGEPSLGVDPLPVRRVVVLSIDGLRADALSGQAYDLPGFSSMIRQGASTLAARTDPGRTVTLPNHTCMITGRPTDGPDGHGFSSNGVTDQTLHEVRGAYVAGIFDVAHDHGLGTGLVASKPKFDLYPNSWDATDGAPDRVPPDHGRAKLDVAFITSYDDDATLGHALDILAAGRVKLLFVHWYECDSAGHGYGFDPRPGTPYAAAVIRQDARLQRLRAALGPNTLFIVTTDHGGTGLGHSDPTVATNFRIPFLVYGPGVRAGADLYALNPGLRQHPGDSRAHEADPPPIRNCEAGNLALSLLNLPPIPGSTIGRQAIRLR